MAKTYAQSIRRILTQRIMIPFTLCNVVLMTVLVIGAIYLQNLRTASVETYIFEREKSYVMSLFSSKGIQIGNLFQNFIIDTQLQRFVLQELDSGRLKQNPASMGLRNQYEFWFNILDNYTVEDPELYVTEYNPGDAAWYKMAAQVRYTNTTFDYGDLDLSG
jgi:hypothetical protein